eukprot:g16976.t1
MLPAATSSVVSPSPPAPAQHRQTADAFPEHYTYGFDIGFVQKVAIDGREYRTFVLDQNDGDGRTGESVPREINFEYWRKNVSSNFWKAEERNKMFEPEQVELADGTNKPYAYGSAEDKAFEGFINSQPMKGGLDWILNSPEKQLDFRLAYARPVPTTWREQKYFDLTGVPPTPQYDTPLNEIRGQLEAQPGYADKRLKPAMDDATGAPAEVLPSDIKTAKDVVRHDVVDHTYEFTPKPFTVREFHYLMKWGGLEEDLQSGKVRLLHPQTDQPLAPAEALDVMNDYRTRHNIGEEKLRKPEDSWHPARNDSGELQLPQRPVTTRAYSPPAPAQPPTSAETGTAQANGPPGASSRASPARGPLSKQWQRVYAPEEWVAYGQNAAQKQPSLIKTDNELVDRKHGWEGEPRVPLSADGKTLFLRKDKQAWRETSRTERAQRITNLSRDLHDTSHVYPPTNQGYCSIM